jgi:signal transduction histidine kinase
MRKPGMTLRVPLLIAAGFMVFAVTVTSVLFIIGRATISKIEMDHLNAKADIYVSAIGFYLNNARSELEVAAQLIAPVAEDSLETRRILAIAVTHSTAFEYIEMVNLNGTAIVIEPGNLEGNSIRRNRSFRKWFQDALRSKTPTVSDLFISLVSSHPTVNITVPIVGADGRMDGILAGSLKLEALSHAGSGATEAVSTGDSGYLTDSRGLVLAHQSKPQYVEDQTDFSSEPTVREALAGNTGTLSFFDPVEKELMLGAYRPIHLTESSNGRAWAVGFVIPQRVAYRPIAAFSRAVGVTAGAFALVLAYVGFVLIRRFLKPLDQLILAVQRAGSGDFSFRITHERNDEFTILTRSYNEMATQLGEKDLKLREHEEQLRGVNRKLEKSNSELEAFSYSVSHDLRAPLRAIDGFSHALIEDFGPLLDTQGQDYLGRIRHAVQKMGNIIEDMLKLSRVNKAELFPELIDLSSMVQRHAEELAARDPGRETEFVIEPAVRVTADRRLMEILLGNLLENAWKFTKIRHKARIEFGQQADSGAPAFFVRDNGVGFDMKYAEKLFQVFQRLHATAEYEGTGIGLAIVKRIANRHGGRAWTEAAAGEGAVFFFSLSGEEVS